MTKLFIDDLTSKLCPSCTTLCVAFAVSLVEYTLNPYHLRSDQIRSDQIRSDQIRSDQIRSDQIRSDDWVEVIAFTTTTPIFSTNVGSS